MELRETLHAWAAAHRLDAATLRLLEAQAGLGAEPADLRRRLAAGLAALAAALGGGGLVFWVAANWPALGRPARFALLQGVFAVMALGAAARPALRAPLALLALLATGGLYAYFGQTYQTGADPWQLFALWALLTLPLCLGVRSDLCWAPWSVVALVGVALWVQAQAGHAWQVRPQDLGVHLAGWALALLIGVALGAPARRFTGAGAWSLRTAFTLLVVMVTATALGGLFTTHGGAVYGSGLLVLAVAAAVFATAAAFDVFVLSALALGLDTLLVAGLARLLFDGAGGDPIGRVLMLGLLAAALLAATVSGVMAMARLHGAAGGAR